MAMTVDEIIQRARRGGYSPGLADDNTMADEVERLRAVEAGHVENIKVRLEQIDRLRSVEAEQSARIASLQGEIGRWATAYNEMHERITTARLALRRVRFNPMETA